MIPLIIPNFEKANIWVENIYISVKFLDLCGLDRAEREKQLNNISVRFNKFFFFFFSRS